MTGCCYGVAPVSSNQTPNDANLVDDSIGAHETHLYSLSTCGIITYTDGAGAALCGLAISLVLWEASRSGSDMAGTSGDEKKILLCRAGGVPSDVRGVG